MIEVDFYSKSKPKERNETMANQGKIENYEGVKGTLIARVSDPSQREALPAQILRLREYSEKLGFG